MEQCRNVVGHRIRYLRNARGISQLRLTIQCARVGFDLSRGTLAKIESQIRGISDIELFVIAHVLSVSINDLFPKALLEDLKNDRIAPYHTRNNSN